MATEIMIIREFNKDFTNSINALEKLNGKIKIKTSQFLIPLNFNQDYSLFSIR
jgi:hypothetical protein